jgi:hypothetical protein
LLTTTIGNEVVGMAKVGFHQKAYKKQHEQNCHEGPLGMLSWWTAAITMRLKRENIIPTKAATRQSCYFGCN